MISGDIEILRRIRDWHYSQAVELRNQGASIDQRCARSRNDLSRTAYEKASSAFHKRANEHFRFVQQLNEFFPANERIV